LLAGAQNLREALELRIQQDWIDQNLDVSELEQDLVNVVAELRRPVHEREHGGSIGAPELENGLVTGDEPDGELASLEELAYLPCSTLVVVEDVIGKGVWAEAGGLRLSICSMSSRLMHIMRNVAMTAVGCVLESCG
jgi:hypothetical protein